MPLNGITFDIRSDVTEVSLDLMRDYIWNHDGNKHVMASQPNRQYLIKDTEDVPDELTPEDIDQSYIIVEESGDIEKGTINPNEENEYFLAYKNGDIKEGEIGWKEVRGLIQS